MGSSWHGRCACGLLGMQKGQAGGTESLLQQHPFFFTGVMGFDVHAVHPFGSGAMAQALW